MTIEKQAVKAIADAIIKAARATIEENNKSYVNNQLRNIGATGGSGGSEYSGSVPASQVSGLYNTVAGYIVNAQANADSGDVIAGKIIQTLSGIASVEVGKARIGYAQIDELDVGVANVIHLTAQQGEITDATIRQLKNDIAQVGIANIGSADISYAQIKDLVAGTSIFREGVGNKLFIDRLNVSEANMVSLTAGEIMLKDASGNFVRLVVNAQTGNVSTERVTFNGDSVINNNSLNATKIIEGSITARELNVTSIFADSALIGAIKATNIDTADLFANTAFLNQIYTHTIQAANAGNDIDISGNSEITLLKNRIALVVDSESTSSSLVLTENMIEAISDQINLMADTIDLSANTSIDLKVSSAVQTATSDLTSRVSTVESTVATHTNQIALTATKTELNQLDDVVTGHTTQIGELATSYDSISLAVSEIKVDYRQNTQPTSANDGDIWYNPDTDTRYQASVENGVITWNEVDSTDFSQIVAKVNGIDSMVGDINGNVSLISQKADKIDWIVASGSSAATMQLTSNMAQLIVDTVEVNAEEIDLSANRTIQIYSGDQIDIEALEDIRVYTSDSVSIMINDLSASLSNDINEVRSTANSAEATAAQVRNTFTFGQNGLRTSVNGSKWSTLVAEDGFYIDHEDVVGHVGSFYREHFVPRNVLIGDIVCRATNNGGWTWNEQ